MGDDNAAEPVKSHLQILHEKQGKKRKRKEDKLLKGLDAQSTEVVVEPTNPLPSTLSIAVPGSILENAQSSELRTYVAGQIARAACIYCVDEIIVFDDTGGTSAPNKLVSMEVDDGSAAGKADTSIQRSCVQMARILQYLECPQYLRKSFFQLHKDLKYCGLLNPLDAPHHLRQSNEFMFREGVVTERPHKSGRGCFVNIGLLNDVYVPDQNLAPGLRVTCKLANQQDIKSKKIVAEVVSPSRPRQDTGVYWGYNVRLANNLTQILTQCPYEDGYDLTIGTSDRGVSVNDLDNRSLNYSHALVVFGGVQGLETALQHDPQMEVTDPSLLYDQYLNTVPGQGSRTIRTEEAVLISLASLSGKLNPAQPTKPFCLSSAIPSSDDTGASQHISKKIKKLVKNVY